MSFSAEYERFVKVTEVRSFHVWSLQPNLVLMGLVNQDLQ